MIGQRWTCAWACNARDLADGAPLGPRLTWRLDWTLDLLGLAWTSMHVFGLQTWVGVDWVGLAWTGLAAIVDWDGLEKDSTA